MLTKIKKTRIFNEDVHVINFFQLVWLGLSGRRWLLRPSCYVKYNNVLLPVNVIKFNIGHLCLLCRPHKGSALLGKWVRWHPVASTSRTSLDARINAWGSVSDLYACSGFHGNKKVEKHCSTGCCWTSQSTAFALVIDLSTGCTTDTALHDWRPSIPCHCSYQSDVFKVLVNI